MNIGLSYNALAQIGHVLGGCFIAEHLCRWTKRYWKVLFLILMLTAVKEFYIDVKFEDVTTRGSDLVDFLFWNVGAVAGLVLSRF